MEQRIKWLIERIAQLTSAEKEELAGLLAEERYDADFTEAIRESLTLEEGEELDPALTKERIGWILGLDKPLAVQHPRGKGLLISFKKRWVQYAAAVLVIIGTAIGLMYRSGRRASVKEEGEQVVAELFQGVKPGGDQAMLTLDDGSTVLLDSSGEGLLSQQGHTNVIKVRGGELAYQGAGHTGLAAGPEKIYYNTITTPRGGQYKVVLPDGSKVWLNAASSLRFPTAFPGTSREVDLTGEAYFEIAADAKKPFHARVGGVSVEVLGTVFNVNGYSDEQLIKTTLLKGRVCIRAAQDTAVLKPGEQAEVPGAPAARGKAAGHITLHNHINTEEAVAWKNGLFYLSSADLASVLRQIGRWYDIDVEFEGRPLSGHITGIVPRSTSLVKMLRILKASGVDFRMEKKKIIVTG